jgi:3-hydroxybutyrate dehydrogenase
MAKFDGKVAVVTGASKGIGASIALHLAAEGAAVVVNYASSKEGADRVVAEIAAKGGKAVAVRANVASQDDIRRLFAETREVFGRLDILVNNAGIFHVGSIDQVSAEKWDAVVAINLSSAFHTIRVALPAMRRQGGGRIINIASALALVGSPLTSAYTAAKHGIIGLTKVVALETAEQNITCNAICPGNVWTPLAEAHLAEQVKTGGLPREQVIRNVLLAEQPNKRFAMVEEIGALTTFLASDAAASITGAALPIDGGWTAH